MTSAPEILEPCCGSCRYFDGEMKAANCKVNHGHWLAEDCCHQWGEAFSTKQKALEYLPKVESKPTSSSLPTKFKVSNEIMEIPDGQKPSKISIDGKAHAPQGAVRGE